MYREQSNNVVNLFMEEFLRKSKKLYRIIFFLIYLHKQYNGIYF